MALSGGVGCSVVEISKVTILLRVNTLSLSLVCCLSKTNFAVLATQVSLLNNIEHTTLMQTTRVNLLAVCFQGFGVTCLHKYCFTVLVALVHSPPFVVRFGTFVY